MSFDTFTPNFQLTTLGTTQPEGGVPVVPGQAGRRQRAQAAFSLAWAAGFVDGEGCICLYKQRYPDPRRKLAYRLGFSITQNDLQTLKHFQQGLGIPGGISEVKRRLQHNRQIYALNYTGVHALNVIALLQPHLIRKQLEPQTAIDYWREASGGQHPGPRGWPPAVIALRERFYQKLKSLK